MVARREVGEEEAVGRDSRYGRILEDLQEGVYFVDRERRITYWNAGAERITGYSSAEVLGRECAASILLHIDEAGQPLCLGFCPMASTIEDGMVRESEVYLRHKQGHRVPVKLRVSPIRDGEGAVVGAVEVFHSGSGEVTSLRRAAGIEEAALLDEATGLGNRKYAEISLGDRLQELRRYGWSFGALLLELDGFEAVRETHGPEAAAEVLRMVGRTLLAGTRSTDFIGRWEGEEFVALVVNVDLARLVQIAERFRMLVARSALGTGGTSLSVTASLGASMASPDDTAQSLVDRLKGLARRARRQGGNAVVSA